MKTLILLTLSMMLFSCASPDRKISSDETLTDSQRAEQLKEFGEGYRR